MLILRTTYALTAALLLAGSEARPSPIAGVQDNLTARAAQAPTLASLQNTVNSLLSQMASINTQIASTNAQVKNSKLRFSSVDFNANGALIRAGVFVFVFLPLEVAALRSAPGATGPRGIQGTF